MDLPSPKTVSLLFLIVLLALAGYSPVFGGDGASIELTPPLGCPDVSVGLTAEFPPPPPGTYFVTVTSVPYGLLSELEPCSILVGDTIVVVCEFTVPESVCARASTVTASLTVDGTVVDSASTSFEIPSTCPGVPPCAMPVGGCVQPVNNLAILPPWLVVIGLVGCSATVVVVARKRRL